MIKKIARRLKIKASIRTKVSGTAERPRLTVFRSNSQIYAQVIDDLKGATLASASSMDKDFSGDVTGNVDAATTVGATIAKKATEKGLKSVVFDRGGYLYHGRVKALAEAARENGLEF